MSFDLSALNYPFKHKPIVVGGAAMEYYSLRKAGDDIDLVAAADDIAEIVKRYPDRVKDLWGDFGVCPGKFEIWKTINMLGYDDLTPGATELPDYLIISLEKLLLMKVEAMDKEEKYLQDAKLIVKRLLDAQYKRYDEVNLENEKLLSNLAVQYIEKREPKS